MELSAPASPAAIPSRGERLRDVRRWLRVTVPRATLGQRADAVYTVAITAAIFGTMAFNAAHTALAEVLSGRGVATWGPGVVALALVVVARWGAYQGPVVYAVADVAHLLGAPLSRRGLAVRKLLGRLVGGAAVAAVLGVVLVVGLEGKAGGLPAARAAGLIGGLALVGVLGVAGAWWVQASARAERALGPLGWVALLAAAALGVVGTHHPGVVRVERWSGPWGWASAPVQAPDWGLALAALAVLAALAAGLALARCGGCPTERHVRRAEARAGAAASLAAFDARSTRRALQAASTPRTARSSGGWLRRGRRHAAAGAPAAGGSAADAAARGGTGVTAGPPAAAGVPAPAGGPVAAGVPAPAGGPVAAGVASRGGAAPGRGSRDAGPVLRLARRDPRFLLAWRGAAALRRTPGRAAEAVVLGAGGAALLVTASDRPTAALAGGLALYVAATRVLEPLRQEIDAPGRASLLLRAAWGRVLAGHVVLPVALVAAAAALAAVACAVSGAGAAPAGALVLTAVLGVPAAALAAALSARRGGRLAPGVLTLANSDASGMSGALVVGWVALFPVLGALAAGGPAALVAHAGAGSAPIALGLQLGVTAILYAVLVSTERP